MPYQIHPSFGDGEWKPKSFGPKEEGWYDASIFAVESVKSKADKPGYKITFRINGGPYDGEDEVINFAGLTSDSIFTIYGILEAAGILGNYYANEHWSGLPTEDELRGLKVKIQIEHEPFLSNKINEQTGVPDVLQGGRLTLFAPIGANPELRRTIRTSAEQLLAKYREERGGGGAAAPAFGGQVPASPGAPGQAPLFGQQAAPQQQAPQAAPQPQTAAQMPGANAAQQSTPW